MNRQQKSLEVMEKQKRAMELRLAGLSYDAIAHELGYAGPKGAHKAVASAMKRTLQEPADALRKVELERLDSIWFGLWEKRGNLLVVDRLIRLSERRAKLLGLDAPSALANYQVDLTTLSDEQLERLAAGEDLFSVLVTKSAG